MKKLIIACAIFLALAGLAAAALFPYIKTTAGADFPYDGSQPDLPAFIEESDIDKEEFMRRRAENLALIRGVDEDLPVSATLRPQAIFALEKKRKSVTSMRQSPLREALTAGWTPIGPAPIPNGQTTGISTPVSGRVTQIAVNPLNADTVFVGTAQGGLYRSLDAGATWTPMLDNALSLAIGAVAIAPSQPDTVYVGTGEGNFSSDSFFGAGIYRIDNAGSVAPTVTGPIGTAEFNGRAISEIVVHPTEPGTIFASSTSAVAGINGGAGGGPAFPARGLYRSTDAASATPTFTKLAVGGASPANFSIRDVVIDPLNPNFLVVHLVASGGGIYVTNNALAPVPTFTHPATGTFTGTTTNEFNGELAVQHTAGQTNPTVYSATGNLGGRLLRSTDGGLTFAQQIDNDFCSPQCFYDIAVDVDPTNSDKVYLGGAPGFVFGFSSSGGTTFTESEFGLHGDTHAIAVAPSDVARIYLGTDGGIYRSDNTGADWTPLNNTMFFATQFMGLDVHPTDTNFTLGGTQDNGTNLRDAAGDWRRADFGDGGFAVIDQNAPDAVNVRMYHTYFNQTNRLLGYATVSSTAQAADSMWAFRGCNGNIPGNGITCGDSVLFYAPLERGPNAPGSLGNTIYYGTDRLYRSMDNGLTNIVVSQAPITVVPPATTGGTPTGVPVSAIGISPQNDNARIVGQRNGGLFGTTSGSPVLTDLDPAAAPSQGMIPNAFIGRVVFAPNSTAVAYVTLTAFGINNVYKTTNLSEIAGATTWTAIQGTGTNVLPQVPVNTLIVDPTNANILYAGTDIGVYSSTDGGANWMPFGTGLPRVAVFDLAFAPGRIVRAATHGKAMYQIAAITLAPTAATVNVAGRVTAKRKGVGRARVSITDGNGVTRITSTNAFGTYRFRDVIVGDSYTFDVKAKRYTFAPQIINISQDINNLNFAEKP